MSKLNSSIIIILIFVLVQMWPPMTCAYSIYHLTYNDGLWTIHVCIYNMQLPPFHGSIHACVVAISCDRVHHADVKATPKISHNLWIATYLHTYMHLTCTSQHAHHMHITCTSHACTYMYITSYPNLKEEWLVLASLFFTVIHWFTTNHGLH